MIGCAMANRANRIAFALVRDQTGYDPGRRAGPQGDSSIAAHSAAPQERSIWSARSAARTNEVDRDEQRCTIGRRGSLRKDDLALHNQSCR